MDNHSEQSSSHYQYHSDDSQLLALTQQNRQLMSDIAPFDVKEYRNEDELNLLLNIAKQLKTHYFTLEQQPFLSLPEKHHTSLELLSFPI